MNKKGFTLIELLAVIVILAVIALIVTPVITGIISGAKNSANARSVEGHIDNVNYAITNSSFTDDMGNMKKYDGIKTETDLGFTYPNNDNIRCISYEISNGVVLKANGCNTTDSKFKKNFSFIKGSGATSSSVESVSIAEQNIVINKGETADLTVNFVPSDAGDKSITYTTDKEGIVSFTNNTITGLKSGVVTITATTSNGVAATTTVTVKDTFVLYDAGTFASGYSFGQTYTDSFYIGNSITYNGSNNSAFWSNQSIPNQYSSLYLRIKSTGDSSYDWAAARIGVRPTNGSDGSSNYTNYFIPGDWYKMGTCVTYTTKDTSYRDYKLDLTGIDSTVVNYYLYFHSAGTNTSITKIWFE